MPGPSRYIVAVLMGLTYVMLILSPLAPLAMKSPGVAHAATGECSGNCDICGCSAERRANHTCCCWMKKLRHQHAGDKEASCCKKKMRHRMTMISCTCPCGGNKQPLLPGAENSEHLPNCFTEKVVLSNNVLLPRTCNRLYYCDADPPDPPPKLLPLS
jgi:hypothetical protein